MKILNFYELIADYARQIQKSIMYFETKTDNGEELQNLYNFYEDKVPLEIYAALMSEKKNFKIYDDVKIALREAEDWFPYRQDLLDEEQHLYVYVCVFDSNGNSMLENA